MEIRQMVNNFNKFLKELFYCNFYFLKNIFLLLNILLIFWKLLDDFEEKNELLII